MCLLWKNNVKRFGGTKKMLYLCNRLGKAGRLAQLVQSICLTSRGSAVRIRQRPQGRSQFWERFLFLHFLYGLLSESFR